MEKNIEEEKIEIVTDKLENKELKVDEVTEGKVTVFLSNEDKSFSAFYNPAQVNVIINF
jgi:tRNA (guanine26-N2/guanine27-N2)-dimethyltransferase